MTTATNNTNGSANKRKNYAELNDENLLSLIGESRDKVALSQLYDRYKLPLGRFLQRQMCETKLIGEVYNDVMLTVWEKANGFRGESKVSTWIFGIAYRTRLAHSRKESRHQHGNDEELISNIAQEEEIDISARTSLNETIHAALQELSEQHRSVIELSYFHGYSIDEISNIVRCPRNTVKTRLFHARKKLKAAIEAEQAMEFVANTSDNTEQQNVFLSLSSSF